jgi:hypothetical protein
MALDIAKLDEHIQSLREGNTLTENEVKQLCEKVSHVLAALCLELDFFVCYQSFHADCKALNCTSELAASSLNEL